MKSQNLAKTNTSFSKKFFYKITPFLLQSVAIFFLKPFFKLFIGLKIEGAENFKKLPKGLIFASNHISYFDPGLLPVSIPFLSKHIPFFYVSRPHKSYTIHEPGEFIFNSFLSESWGSFEFIPGKKDYAESLRNHMKIVSDGSSLCIFPEGKISKDGQINPEDARGGLGYLAFATGKPVIPVKISGSFNMTIKDFFLRRRSVSITFGKPVFYSSEDGQSSEENVYKSFSQKVLRLVQDL